MKIPYRDLAVKDAALKAELLTAVDRVLSHGRLVLGPETEAFEAQMAERCGRQYAVGVGSGTDALYLTLRGLDIGLGDEVIVPALSWIATANPVVVVGATPVFVDIRDDLNIDPDLVEEAITPRTKAIIAVHFTGRLCAIERLVDIATRRGLVLIEDAAQAFGAGRNGRVAGSFGHASCFSMNAMKVLNAYGDAGAIVTDDGRLRDRLLALRYAGVINKQDCHWPALNGRLDALQAAMLMVSLRHLPHKLARIQAIARLYDESLDGVVTCPRSLPGETQVYYAYSILAERRDALREHLAKRGVETQVQHPIAMPNHTAYKNRYRAAVPRAEALVQRILCLPNHDYLTLDDAGYVARQVREFYGA